MSVFAGPPPSPQSDPTGNEAPPTQSPYGPAPTSPQSDPTNAETPAAVADTNVSRMPPRPDSDPMGAEDTLSTLQSVPAAPVAPVATPGSAAHASIAFVHPADPVGLGFTHFHVVATSSDGGAAANGNYADTPAVVAALTSGKHYTFTVAAANHAGTGPASPASNSIVIA